MVSIVKTTIRFCFILVSFSFFTLQTVHATLYINEILASAKTEDEAGTTMDWIEIYNSGPDTINLRDYSLTDDPAVPDKWKFGSATRIVAGNYIRVWTTGYGISEPDNPHTNFRLDRDGEFVGLNDPAGNIIDSLTFPEQYQDVSYGRRPDGGSEWRFFQAPTPAAANDSASIIGYIESPVFSMPAGIYGEAFPLVITSYESGVQIRYTLDGSPPDESSSLYQNPIDIAATTIVRAQAFRTEYLPSPVVTQSYFFLEKTVLPILSIVTDPDNLWGRTNGIYSHPSEQGKEWERPCSVEYFTMNRQRGFAINAGLRIHGGASRQRSPKKSFRLYFRSEYGKGRLEYPLFPSTGVKRFNQIVLRAGFNDSWGYDREMQRETATYISDQVARDLHLDMSQPVAHGMFAELYLNGEYWGLYNPTERIEDDNLAEHSGIDAWTVGADGAFNDGDPELWQQFDRWVTRTEFSDSDGLEAFQSVVDLENFTTYIILNIWLQNYDWPHHNWYIARENTPDGKWKFFLWDVEYAFGSGIQGYRIDQNTVQTVNNPGVPPIGTLFNKISKNSQYREYFWRTLNGLLETVLSEEHVLERLNRQGDTVRPAIPAEAKKWGVDKTPGDWERAMELAREFVRERTPIVLKHVAQVMGPAPVGVRDWELY